VLSADRAWKGYVFAVIPIAIAAAFPVWQMQFESGWLEMALGGSAWLFWIAVLTWAICLVVAIRRFKWWWLLLTAPVVLFPVVIAGGILSLCQMGHCL
jgi:hypothetical protein